MSEQQSIQCIGFIMDGNRRWAKARGLPTLAGHERGAFVFTDTVRFVRDHSIPHAVFYGFSTENWGRSAGEVSGLMELMAGKAKELIEKLLAENTDEQKVRFRFIGNREAFSPELQHAMREIEAVSSAYATTTIWVALSYGGRHEIVQAVNRAIAAGKEVDEASFGALLASAEMPDPDLIVRTGGASRLSNFLPWQSVYSELVFIETLWPEVTSGVLEGVLAAYAARLRNFGK